MLTAKGIDMVFGDFLTVPGMVLLGCLAIAVLPCAVLAVFSYRAMAEWDNYGEDDV